MANPMKKSQGNAHSVIPPISRMEKGSGGASAAKDTLERSSMDLRRFIEEKRKNTSEIVPGFAKFVTA